jgi:hypothetical protein
LHAQSGPFQFVRRSSPVKVPARYSPFADARIAVALVAACAAVALLSAFVSVALFGAAA